MVRRSNLHDDLDAALDIEAEDLQRAIGCHYKLTRHRRKMFVALVCHVVHHLSRTVQRITLPLLCVFVRVRARVCVCANACVRARARALACVQLHGGARVCVSVCVCVHVRDLASTVGVSRTRKKKEFCA